MTLIFTTGHVDAIPDDETGNRRFWIVDRKKEQQPLLPRLTMPSTGGLNNRNFKYLGDGTSLDLHKRMARYRVAVSKEVPLPLKHPKGHAL